MRNMTGKKIIVTGANSGMGMATASLLADMGAEVIMLCRSEKRGKEAFDKLKEKQERKIYLRLCDLGNFQFIDKFVTEVSDEFGNIDVLINNAGFISLDRQLTDDGLERQFGVNHIGHFLLTMKLIPYIKKGGRIINVASGAHKAGKIHFDDINLTHGYNVVKAYSQSKLANVLFTRELARRLEGEGITVNCCHPGAVATNMGVNRETGFGKLITGMLKPFFLRPEEGAETAVFLASDDSVKDITGEYFYKCKIAKSSERSKDMNLALRLFELSETITGYKSEI